MINASSMAATNEYKKAGQIIGTALGLGFWAMIWFFPTADILALVTKLKKKPLLLCRNQNSDGTAASTM